MAKAIVIYDSVFGNCQRLAELLNDSLRAAGNETMLVKADRFEQGMMDGSDIVLVGGPTHKGSASEGMRNALDAMKGADLRGAIGYVFDTKFHRMKHFSSFTAGRLIQKQLKRCGVTMPVPRRSIFVMTREGPLEDGATAMVKEDVERLMRALEGKGRA